MDVFQGYVINVQLRIPDLQVIDYTFKINFAGFIDFFSSPINITNI